MSTIPTYALYGEHESGEGDWLHWETITSRSKLHGFRIGAHRHDHLYQILHIEEGTAEVMIDGERRRVSPPAIILVPPMTVHSFAFSPDVAGHVLTFFAEDVRTALASIGDRSQRLLQPAVLGPSEGVVSAADISLAVQRLIAETDRVAPGHVAALRARLTLLLVAAYRLVLSAGQSEKGAQNPWERHARAFAVLVDRHYRDTRRIGFYASKVGVTPTHLNRISRQVLGDTALGVIERRIIVEARRYLQFSDLSVKEIGILLGYADPAYFSRFFARNVGRGPLAYRQDWPRVSARPDP